MIPSGSKIGVFAPSSYVEQGDIEASREVMIERGHDIFVHPQCFARHNQSAGTHQEKLDALHSLYADDSVDVIWAAGGGNRALHILDGLDFDLISKHPKPMIGFSDVTALLNAISEKTGITNIHAPVFRQVAEYKILDKLLSGDFSLPLDHAETFQNGRAEGRLLGGNLSLFQYLLDDIDNRGAIIFLEDCNEELSRIDRMLMHLKRAGVFDRAGGLIFGQFTDLQDSAKPFGFTLRDIIAEHTEGLNIPIVMNAPFGHGDFNYPIKVGAQAVLDTQNALSLKYID